MMYQAKAIGLPKSLIWQYVELTKPRVVLLMLVTAFAGMLLSVSGPVPWVKVVFGLLGIALAAAAGAAFNHIVDRRIDGLMSRTRGRPIPSGQLDTESALIFALLLTAAAVLTLLTWTNPLATLLTVTAMVGYAVFYTVLLKRTTPQNIVWGGAAGAAPPVLGGAVVSGELTTDALLLFLIIFVWTPPHFWPLAIHRCEEYRRAGIPMLPVTHGVGFTKRQILLYSWMLFAVTLLPFAAERAGLLYLAGAVPLALGFIYHAARLAAGNGAGHAMATFRYSIVYLFALFVLLLGDRALAPF